MGRTAIAYHADRNVLQSLTCHCFEADIVTCQITHDADDAHVFLYAHRSVLLQFVDDVLKVVAVVYGNADTDLTGANHVDAGLVGLEDFEHFTQEAVCQEHSAAVYLDADVPVASCHCLDGATLELVVDDSPGSRGVHRVEQTHRDASELGRLDAGGMQYLCAEVGKFCCLFEVELAHRLGMLHKARVVIVHTINVGPYLNLLCLNGSANQASCIVAAAAQQVVYLTLSVAADEALRDIDLIAWVVIENLRGLLLDIVHVGFTVLVGTDDVEGIDEQGIDATFLQVVGDHVSAHYFALSQDDLLLEGREVNLGEGAQIVELFVQELRSLLLYLFRAIEFVHVLGILLFEQIDDGVCSFRVLLVEVIGDFHQCIGSARHGGEDNDFALAVIGNELGDVLHSLRRPYGGATKLQNFHIFPLVKNLN